MNATQSHLTALRAIARSIDGEPVTAEEMEAVAAWRGWGPAAKMLENHSPHRSEIIATLDEEQLEAAKRATTTAFYTPPWLAASIWSGVRRSLGFTGGRVLEAGCGSGLFFDDAVGELVGVEADPVTAEAARLRHPEATIVTSRFERFTAPAGSFDLVIGNVPFGKDTPYDPIDNPAGLAIHNYFIAKALRLVRPGGVVAVVTSRFTLDAGTTKARDEIARWGSLLGVVRFPEGTFADMGTNVVADLLIFRRDDVDGSPRLADASWRASTKLAGRYDLEIPRYMRNRDDTIPTMNTLFDVGSPTVGVVGELVVGSGMYGSGSVTWRLDHRSDTQREVTKTVARVFDAVAATHTFDDAGPLAPFDPTAATPDAKILPGTIRIAGSGFERFTAIDGWIGHDAGREAAELTALIELRDAVRTMLDDRNNRDNVVELHAAYTKRWGSLRRVGGTATAPRYPKLGGFRVDPGWPLVASLEIGLTAPAPVAEVVVNDLAGAIAVSLDRTGGLDVDMVAELLNVTADSVHEQLTDKRLAFADPLTGRWMMADEYLSGDVRTRHAQAVAAGAEPNISALAEVVPADATPEEVAARLGAAWIAPEIVAAFINELVSPGRYGGGVTVEHAAEIGQWKVVPGPRKEYSTSLTAGTWGTPWMDTFDIVQGMLNMSALRVWESMFVNGAESKRIDNAATEAVNEKAAEIAARFGEWVWEDPDRTETLLAEFNRRFRSHRGRNFDGSHQTFPGLNPAFVPHDHQRDVVWRVVASGNTLIGHDVGAGKALRVDQPVITPTGERPIGELKVGDPVIGRDGKEYQVLGVFPQGERDLFNVEFTDGSVVVADSEHIWEVQTPNDRMRGSSRLETTQSLLDAGMGALASNGAVRRNWFVPMCEPVAFPTTEVSIDPYLLGVILGDGHIGRTAVRVTSADQQVIDEIDHGLQALGLYAKPAGQYDWRLVFSECGRDTRRRDLHDTYRRLVAESGATSWTEYNEWSATQRAAGRNTPHGSQLVAFAGKPFSTYLTDLPEPNIGEDGVRRLRNPLLLHLEDMGLAGRRSHDKFVPRDYLITDVESRVSILQGLLDTDGCAERCGASFTTVSPQLAADMKFLVESLGGTATLSMRKPTYNSCGDLREGRLAYTVRIKLPSHIRPFRLRRKMDRYRTGQRPPYRAIRSITPAGRDQAVCIKVSAPDSLFLTANFIPTHNTASLIMSAMESRRLGLVNKPMIVVPNHMLEQFTADFMSLYPKANVLAAGRHETSASERAEFVAAAAIGDWDAIVCTHNAFGRIGLSDESMADYIRDEIAWFDAAIGENTEQRSVVKAIERRKRSLEAKLERLVLGQQRDDTAVSFEDLQVDALWVDEAHRYKNLAVNTRSDIATGNPSKTASDLDAKLAWIRSTYDPNRAIVFATGTPISNTLAELWVVHHYVDPASLEEAGLAEFDTWLATFAEVVTGLEMDPSGTGWRMKSRIARFSNAPEMVLMFSRFADIQTHEDLDLALPDCTRSIETVDCSPELAEAMEQFMERADRIRARMVKSDEDNFLKLSTDARHASLDPRLVGLDAPSDGGKIGRCVDRCARNRHGLQIVFCDLGTPGSTRFDMYAELRSQLVARGFESDRIRFVQDAKTDKAKESLFAACRNGDVDVVIGSTGTFGEGTNIQDRVTAIHHLDAPWRPSDIRQRDGRGVRQGNPNHVRIYRYVVTGSFDAFMWGTLERKARFIEQVYRSEARAIEDVDGDAVFTFAEVKAVASGNSALLRRAELENLIAKHRRSRTGHIRTNRHRRSMIKDLGAARSNLVRRRDALLILEHLDGALASNPAFARRYSQTPFDAEEMAIEVLGGRDHQVMVNPSVTLTMRRRGARRIDAEFSFNYDPLLTFEVSAKDLRDEAVSTLHRLWATFLTSRPGHIAELDEEIATTETEIVSLREQTQAAWAGDGELAALEAELIAIDEELRQASAASVGTPTDSPAAEADEQRDEMLVA